MSADESIAKAVWSRAFMLARTGQFELLDPDTRARVVQLMADYLLASASAGWPGTDGLTQEEVVRAAYPRAVIAGHVPGVLELRDRHADLGDAISSFLAEVTSG
jgi:hypothetical protein